ncbi:MAG: hypothetical protein ACI4M8_03760 [Christensenellales bacterium]
MAGRRNLYDTNIKPNFEQIDKMLNDGASEKQCAEALGVSYASFNNYKVKYKELDDLCRKPRTKLVENLRSALVKRALGMKVEKKKIYSKKDEDGNEIKYTEITIDELPPDVAALNLALKNYDRDNWANDPQTLALKREELDLKKELADFKEW